MHALRTLSRLIKVRIQSARDRPIVHEWRCERNVGRYLYVEKEWKILIGCIACSDVQNPQQIHASLEAFDVNTASRKRCSEDP